MRQPADVIAHAHRATFSGRIGEVYDAVMQLYRVIASTMSFVESEVTIASLFIPHIVFLTPISLR